MKLILQAIKSLLNKINIRLAELENKTSDENIADGKFLPDGTPYVEVVPVSYLNKEGILQPALGDVYSFPGKLKLTAGELYTVIYNGVTYVCECEGGESGNRLSKNGVFSLSALNEPIGGTYIALVPYDNPESVTLSVLGTSRISHKMDAKLLPEEAVFPLIVKCVDDVPDHTYIEAREAIWSGREVVIFREHSKNRYTVYTVSEYVNGYLNFYSEGDYPHLRSKASWVSSPGITFTEEALGTLTIKGKDSDGVEHTWDVYSGRR